MFSPTVQERRDAVQPVRLMRVDEGGAGLRVVVEVVLGDHVAGVAVGGAAQLGVGAQLAQAAERGAPG